MLNLPGTLLIVRRRTRGTGDPATVSAIYERIPRSEGQRFPHGCEIPYGEVCIMTNYVVHGEPSAHTKNPVYDLHLLWRERKVIVSVSDRKVNTWFAHPNTWKARGHDLRLEEFHADGRMKRLYTYTRNTDLIRGTT